MLAIRFRPHVRNSPPRSAYLLHEVDARNGSRVVKLEFYTTSTFPGSILGPQGNEDIQFLHVPQSSMDVLLPVLPAFTPVENDVDIMDPAMICGFGNRSTVKTELGIGLSPSFSRPFNSRADPGNSKCPKRRISRMIMKFLERRYLSDPFQAIIIFRFCDDHAYLETLYLKMEWG